jgi:hypothetical protein
MASATKNDGKGDARGASRQQRIDAEVQRLAEQLLLQVRRVLALRALLSGHVCARQCSLVVGLNFRLMSLRPWLACYSGAAAAAGAQFGVCCAGSHASPC